MTTHTLLALTMMVLGLFIILDAQWKMRIEAKIRKIEERLNGR